LNSACSWKDKSIQFALIHGFIRPQVVVKVFVVLLYDPDTNRASGLFKKVKID